jgi:hypothetical protein
MDGYPVIIPVGFIVMFLLYLFNHLRNRFPKRIKKRKHLEHYDVKENNIRLCEQQKELRERGRKFAKDRNKQLRKKKKAGL